MQDCGERLLEEQAQRAKMTRAGAHSCCQSTLASTLSYACVPVLPGVVSKLELVQASPDQIFGRCVVPVVDAPASRAFKQA